MVIGVQDVKERALIKKVEFPDGSMIVEATAELGGRGIASEGIFCKRLYEVSYTGRALLSPVDRQVRSLPVWCAID